MIIVVDSTGHGDFKTVQEAIDAAFPGDVVDVRGTFVLDKPIDMSHKKGVELRGGTFIPSGRHCRTCTCVPPKSGAERQAAYRERVEEALVRQQIKDESKEGS